MSDELAKVYDPKAIEADVRQRWIDSNAFAADPAIAGDSYTIVIPPPNVTAPLHLGHALNNTLQDVLIRYHRMAGDNTLWMPGTDHAGIATQTVVEKRILAEENKRRTDFEREEFVGRVQAWKDEYEVRIIDQLKLMGCSCDWDRTRFTMDDVCAKAVRETFFKLFADGLIYRGKRLVNWDPATQTVLADDEVEHHDVAGHFWYLRYPLTEPVEVGSESASESGMGILPMRPEGILPSEDTEITKRRGSNLPHWTQHGAKYAVAFRLADALPQDVLNGWKQEREDIVLRADRQSRELTSHERQELDRLYSARIESFLDAGQGACHLRDPRIATLVQEALKHFDGQRYDLIAWCVMPNHVHVVLRPLAGNDLSDVLHSWKSFTAKEVNSVLGLSGQFWQEEYYDHLIRDEEDFNNQINYVLGNPLKAGLTDWAWSGYCPPKQQEQEQDAPATHGQDAHATKIATMITHVTVATTRPETMLGDTAIAMNPRDPRAKALVGKTVRLPLVGRTIPIVADEHVVLADPDSEDEKAKFSTGFLKVTPAHDPDDWQIGLRHDLPVINVMAPDGTISDQHGWEDCTDSDAEFLLNMDRFEARAAIVEWFTSEGLLADVRDYTHPVGHSYRSHVPIEPYLSDQWYIEVKKPIEHLAEQFGEGMIDDTDVPQNSLAGLALKPLLDSRISFTPDRYEKTYATWLENLRDWPISRQLWWGHQIPVWRGKADALGLGVGHDGTWDDTKMVPLVYEVAGAKTRYLLRDEDGEKYAYIAVPPGHRQAEAHVEAAGYQQDPDVLDTWFSSALWPFSTMGWPEKTPELDRYYPGNLLCTAREIITLWVSRMVMMGQYCVGDIPFTEVFIHAMIQDGQGRKMSKSLGNGIDPLDIIDSHGSDAMRFTLASMTTQTQDVRMPVEQMTTPDGRTLNSSAKFDVGRNFCNKLWNASRFAMMNLEDCPAFDEAAAKGNLADAWILSRLATVIRDTTAAMGNFRYNELADGLYHFMWSDLCDWYLEIAKSRINAGDASPKAIVAICLDRLLRLLHPICPFITEAIWTQLNEIAPDRLGGGHADMLVRAAWPGEQPGWISEKAEADFALLADLVRQVRNVRKAHDVPPSRKVDAILEATGEAAALMADNADLLASQANLGTVTLDAPAPTDGSAATVTAGGAKLHLLDIIDRDAELARLTKQAEQLTKGISGTEAKLGNDKFVAKAPADVVERERERLTAMQADLAAVQQAIESLS